MAQSMRILLIEDSEETGLLVRRCLPAYEIVQAFSIQEASELLATPGYCLFLIDVSLPDGDGFSFCEKLVKDERFGDTPKIFLSAHDDSSAKVFGLNCGGDDYITKPFELAEFRARIASRLRTRKAVAAGAATEFAGIKFESDFQRCMYNGEDLGLTPTEFRILLALARADGKPLSRDEIIREVWTANGMHIEKRGVDSHIAHLRQKLARTPARITSVYGRGYALTAESPA